MTISIFIVTMEIKHHYFVRISCELIISMSHTFEITLIINQHYSIVQHHLHHLLLCHHLYTITIIIIINTVINIIIIITTFFFITIIIIIFIVIIVIVMIMILIISIIVNFITIQGWGLRGVKSTHVKLGAYDIDWVGAASSGR